MSEVELQDHILRQALQLLRLSAGQQREVEGILKDLAKELRALVASEQLSAASKREIEALIAQAEKVIRPAYAKVAATTDTHAIAVIVAKQTVHIIEDVIPAEVLSATPQTLSSLTKDVLIEGAPTSAWWDKQSEDTAFRFAAAVRQGVINGETNERIVQRVVGGREAGPGIMDIARRNARALVHSSVMAAANDARLATFKANGRLIAGVRWLSVLDGHTCKRCAALDGQSWDLDGNKLKGTRVEFMAPPIHWNDRCVLSPVPRSFRDMGLDIDEPGAGTRASSEGPVHSATTFDQFLKRNPAEAEEILGKRRLALFEKGAITVKDLVSGTGRELTLEELGVH